MSITAIAIKFFGPRAAKAVLSGGLTLGGTILGAVFGPEVVSSFESGISSGLSPAAEQIGYVIGSAVGALLIFLVGHIPVYKKANKPDPKES